MAKRAGGRRAEGSEVDPRAFFRPSLEDPIRDVLGARRTLLALLDDGKRGEVRKPEGLDARTNKPERDGLHCCKIFGPLEDFVCLCGQLRGREHAGEHCPRCGVEIAESVVRNERFGMISAPYGLLHPALAPVIGELLGLSAEDVLAVARANASFDDRGAVVRAERKTVDSQSYEETGSMAILARLEKAAPGRFAETLAAAGAPCARLVLGMVPVVPPGDRPLRRGAGGGRIGGPIDAAYARYLDRQRLLTRLAELETPMIVWWTIVEQVQLAFERLIRVVAKRGSLETDRTVSDPFEVERPSGPAFGWEDLAALGARAFGSLHGCALLGDDELALQGRFATVVLRGSTVTQRVASAGLVLLAASSAERRLFFGGQATVRHSLLNLGDGAWLDRPPDRFPRGWMTEELESAYLVNADGRCWHASEVLDYPKLYALSPDGRFAWISDKEGNGGIYDTDSGLRELEASVLDLDEDEVRELPRIDAGVRSKRSRRLDGDEVFAFALGRDQRWRIALGNVVLREDKPWFTFRFAACCASFDLHGERLLLVGDETAIVIDVSGDEPRLLHSMDLTPALEALRWQVPGIKIATRLELAWSYGTVEAAARATDDELRAFGLSSAAIERLRKPASRRPRNVK